MGVTFALRGKYGGEKIRASCVKSVEVTAQYCTVLTRLLLDVIYFRASLRKSRYFMTYLSSSD